MTEHVDASSADDKKLELAAELLSRAQSASFDASSLTDRDMRQLHMMLESLPMIRNYKSLSTELKKREARAMRSERAKAAARAAKARKAGA